ncbi:MAG: nucleotide sugar dehydrogenase [Firmicutes bacterium]|nr:nucleotide sugar dehydrogenase [Bacillota bacterium]
MSKKKITIVGAGYVGLSLAALLCQKHHVVVLDISKEKVDAINQKQSPIKDEQISQVLKQNHISLVATQNKESAYLHAEVVFVCVPTNYDPEKNYFDTKYVDEVIQDGMQLNPNAIYVIKSTIPVGYTEMIQHMYHSDTIFFSPEFLREDHALYDNLYPSRIIIGSDQKEGHLVGELLKESALKLDVVVLHTSSTNAEAIKLFSNTYLAMRISYFNELDTFAEIRGLDTKDIIKGVSLDPRIGAFYNNPSFGYGGYCLPKDTKQLLSNYEWVPQNLIEAIVISNETRKDHIVDMIMKKEVDMIGIYRLTMKKDSDNMRDSSIFGVIQRLKDKGKKVMIYEPLIKETLLDGTPVFHNLEEFKRLAGLVVCNRMEPELIDIKHKVYTRDIFYSDT